ncbi:MAG: hypothetical protein HQK91_09835 [Nitrospirae bacterium]|nr:hypothetical protein [Nitrospirota bacterium]MBF0541734.1 hypothetical protein [Nitrospirota bacterium]
MEKGIVRKLLKEVYRFKNIDSIDALAHQRIIKLQLTLKTGLSMSKYSETSIDSQDEFLRIIDVLKNPEFGLTKFKFDQFIN